MFILLYNIIDYPNKAIVHHIYSMCLISLIILPTAKQGHMCEPRYTQTEPV